MGEIIEIEHLKTSFTKRIRKYILLYLFLVFLFGAFSVLKSDNKKGLSFFIVMSIIFAAYYLFKILKTKIYMTSFYSDSHKVIVHYFNGFQEKIIESNIENTKTRLKNTSSRAGFDCELLIKIENLNFLINTDFDWDLGEIKKLFEYIQYHKKIELTEQDKFTISRIENKVKKLETSNTTANSR